MYVVAVVEGGGGGGYTIDLLYMYIMGDYGRERTGAPN